MPMGFVLYFIYYMASAPQHYVGATTCQSCHAKEYEIWKNSPHAKAFDSLLGTQKKEGQCLICHQLPLSNVSHDSTALLEQGVQCESCHGPGRYYSKSYVMKDKELSQVLGLLPQTPQVCLQCHNSQAPMSTPFDIESAWKKIAHGKNKSWPLKSRP